jgi:hypothetical protein
MPTDEGTVSDAVANALLNYLWRGDAAAVMPGTTHWGLSTTEPTTTGTGITEPTDTAYALIAVTRDHATFAAAAARSITTAVDIAFPAADAGGAGYGLVGWIPVWDDASRTNFLGYWVVTGGPQAVGAGIAPTFPAGSLTWVYGA